MSKENLAIVTKEDLSLVGDNSLNEKQLQQILQRTPKHYLKSRPAKGGGTWAYVSGGYIKKCLNLMFGWDWDFEIIDEQIYDNEVVVKGRLTCRTNGRSITKMQYGNKDRIKRKSDGADLSIGNDLKAAATDCLKKCASEIGIAADVYNAEEFKEVSIKESTSIEDIDSDKERQRLVDFIKSAKSRKELVSIVEHVEEAGLVEVYDEKLKSFSNGKKVEA